VRKLVFNIIYDDQRKCSKGRILFSYLSIYYK
jgi:hypothetical protein